MRSLDTGPGSRWEGAQGKGLQGLPLAHSPCAHSLIQSTFVASLWGRSPAPWQAQITASWCASPAPWAPALFRGHQLSSVGLFLGSQTSGSGKKSFRGDLYWGKGHSRGVLCGTRSCRWLSWRLRDRCWRTFLPRLTFENHLGSSRSSDSWAVSYKVSTPRTVPSWVALSGSRGESLSWGVHGWLLFYAWPFDQRQHELMAVGLLEMKSEAQPKQPS